MNDDALFCPKCGTKVVIPVAPESPSAPVQAANAQQAPVYAQPMNTNNITQPQGTAAKGNGGKIAVIVIISVIFIISMIVGCVLLFGNIAGSSGNGNKSVYSKDPSKLLGIYVIDDGSTYTETYEYYDKNHKRHSYEFPKRYYMEWIEFREDRTAVWQKYTFNRRGKDINGYWFEMPCYGYYESCMWEYNKETDTFSISLGSGDTNSQFKVVKSDDSIIIDGNKYKSGNFVIVKRLCLDIDETKGFSFKGYDYIMHDLNDTDYEDNSYFTEEDFIQIKKLKNLEYLGFTLVKKNTGDVRFSNGEDNNIAIISDKSFFNSWPELKYLDLFDVMLEDTNILTGLKKLECLAIGMSDEHSFNNTHNKRDTIEFDLNRIKDMPNIKSLEVYFYNVDLKCLSQMKQLEYLHLIAYYDWSISVVQLKNALPDCNISCDSWR